MRIAFMVIRAFNETGSVNHAVGVLPVLSVVGMKKSDRYRK